MKLGYSTWGMPRVPVDEAFAHLAGFGFDGVELSVIPGYTTELSRLDAPERKRIRQLLDENRLLLPAISAHSNLLSDDPTAHRANIARLKGAIDLAVELAQGDLMPVVNTTSGYRCGRWDDIKDMLVERTKELVEYAQTRTVTIAIEPHVGAAIDTPERMLQLLESVDSPYLMVNLDISHFDVIGLRTEDVVSKLAPYIANTHVKDQRGRMPAYEFLIPGEGDFDYIRYLKTMLAHGYEGFITVEISFMVQRRPDYDPFAAAKFSYETLSHAFIEAGIPMK